MKLAHISSILLLMVSLFATAEEARFSDLSVTAAQALISKNHNNPDFYLLDVRTEQEFKQAHIEGAQQLDFYHPEFAKQLASLDTSKTYLVYCRSGARSAKTLALMKKLAFKKVYNMQGGIIDWHRQQLPLVIN